jgi:Tfp pilus assembly major pilin PilA
MNPFTRFIRSFNYGQSGFTLFQLLIAIALLAILANFGIPRVSKFVENRIVSVANSELALVYKAITTGMASAEVSSVTTGTLSSSQDFTIASGFLASFYFQKGIEKLVGTYKIDTNGVVSSATYPGGPTWDGSTGKFQ